MANGNYVGSELIMNIKFDREKSIYQKTVAKYEFGKIYLHYGRNDEEKSAFEFVINNGNKLYIVQEAKAYLQQLI